MHEPRRTDAAGLIRRGLADHQAGRLQQAEVAYNQALAIDPAHPEALNLLGRIAYQTGRVDQAADYVRRAVEANPALPQSHNNLGIILRGAGRAAEAEACFRNAIRLLPAYPEAHSNLANALHDLGRFPESEACCREAVRLRPDFPEAHNNLGNVLCSLGRFAEAATSCREALRLRPGFADACNNLGNALYCLARPAEAEASYRQALRLRPDWAEVHEALARVLLLLGRLPEGWEENEQRWNVRRIAARVRAFAAPLWDGEAPSGRVILLHAEQGFGDTLQFCRYVPMVAAQASVVLEVPPPLVRLLARLPGIKAIVARGDPLPPFDLHCPLLSLPRVFRTDLDTIPAAVPYLSASPAQVSEWRARLAGIEGLRVGLVWAGGQRPDPSAAAMDARRSIAIAMLAPLAEVRGVSFVSLQKGAPTGQGANPPGLVLHDFTAGLGDFADTAALVENLDLVISVDTSVVHLAGALGKPTWLLNRFDTCWRWLLDRDDSPWYPTLRQFRQPSPGDWTSAIQAVRDALQHLAAGDRDQLRPRNAIAP